jgi:hypothetical protein
MADPASPAAEGAASPVYPARRTVFGRFASAYAGYSTRPMVSRALASAISLLLLLPVDALARAGGGSRGFGAPRGGGGTHGFGRGGGHFFFFGGGGGGLFFLLLLVVLVLVLSSRGRRRRRF